MQTERVGISLRMNEGSSSHGQYIIVPSLDRVLAEAQIQVMGAEGMISCPQCRRCLQWVQQAQAWRASNQGMANHLSADDFSLRGPKNAEMSSVTTSWILERSTASIGTTDEADSRGQECISLTTPAT